MPEHKNQHFVPRVLLRPFTKDAGDKSINLYNISSDRLIHDAPVKGQCSRHYWYGEDGQLESILSRLEGIFGTTRKEVAHGSNTEDLRSRLRDFVNFQHWRTAKAAARLRDSHEKLLANSWAVHDDPMPTDKQLVISAMRFGLLARDYVSDLKVRIVENRTKRDFIISDDPAVMLNRFAHERLRDSAFGTSSSGLTLAMPISPRLVLRMPEKDA